MSKATVITSEMMTRQEDETPQVKPPRKPTLASVVKAIADTRKEFGTPAQAQDAAGKAVLALREIEQAEQEARGSLKRSETATRRWQRVALLSESSDQSAAEFGRQAGGNNNTRVRLTRAAGILAAAKEAGITVPFWQAVADGNAHSAKRSEHVISELANGRDPYASVATTEDGKALPGSHPKGRRSGKGYTVPRAEHWAEVVRGITALVPKQEALTDSQWADLDKAVRALALAVSKRAGTAPKRAPRTVKAA